MERLQNSIIIHGPGRSGTTLFAEILSLHPELYYLNGFINKYPKLPVIATLSWLYKLEFFERWTRSKGIKWWRSSEAYNFWDYHLLEVSAYIEDGDVSDAYLTRTVKKVERIGFYSPGNRFFTKITGLARGAFIDSLFEDPVILYIDRDPRAVVASYYEQRWRYKNKPEVFARKTQEELIAQYCDIYMSHYHSKVEELQHLPNFHQLYYEDLVADPISFFKHACELSNLPRTAKFENLVYGWGIKQGTNDKWKKKLTDSSIQILKEKLKEPIQFLEYGK